MQPDRRSAGPLSRRSLLRATGLSAMAVWAGLGAGLAGPRAAKAGSARPGVILGDRRRVLRVAHLTDLHIQPERRAAEGVAACLNHLATPEVKPDLILTGGDLIMDAFAADESRTRLQWELLTKAFKDHAPCPVAHTLGNHDIWGWNRKKSKTSGSERQWGKAWALEQLGMTRPYHSFDKAGWHFICLDSVRPRDEDGYQAFLDDEQMAWLKADLAATPKATPVLVVSHISIFAASPILDGNPSKPVEASYGVIHRDAPALHRMFRAHGNVRLALSGHMHRLDRTEIDGVCYICDGAVSGSWWKGRKDNCDEGYGLFDLCDDGSYDYRYQTFGWRAEG